jgi:hypothetical protein
MVSMCLWRSLQRDPQAEFALRAFDLEPHGLPENDSSTLSDYGSLLIIRTIFFHFLEALKFLPTGLIPSAKPHLPTTPA